MALPVTIGEQVGQQNSFHGPFISLNGDVFTILIESQTIFDGQIDAFRATDPTDSFTVSDTGNRPTMGGSITDEVLSLNIVQVGDDLHIVTQNVLDDVFYARFDMSGNSNVGTWDDVDGAGNEEQEITGAADGAADACDLVVRTGQTDVLAVFQWETESDMGADFERIAFDTKADLTTGAWGGSPAYLGTNGMGVAVDVTGPRCVYEAVSGRTHVVFIQDTSGGVVKIHHSSISSSDVETENGDIIETPAILANTFYAIGHGVLFDRAGTKKIRFPYVDIGIDLSIVEFNDAASPSYTFEDGVDGSNNIAVDNASVNACLAVDGSQVHEIHTRDSDDDLYTTDDADSDTWGTPTSTFIGIVNHISCNIFTRDGGLKLAQIILDGTSVKYDEDSLAADGVLTGVGDAAGAATTTAVGVMTAKGDGAAAGVATTTAVGNATAKADGAAAGSATTTAVGQLLVRGVGASDGVATTAAIGNITFLGIGAAAGIAASTAIGNITAAADGAAAGAATSTAIGNAVTKGVGAAAGAATALADGEAKVKGVGASAGAATTTAVGVLIIPGVGASDGTSTATAVGNATALGVGSADGVATSTAVGLMTAKAVGSSNGTSTALADGEAKVKGAGAAAGTSTATADGEAKVIGAGTAAGAATSTAVGNITFLGDGLSAGIATATATGVMTATGVGAAAGTSTATGIFDLTLKGVGAADGTSTAAAIGNARALGIGSSDGVAVSLAIGNITFLGVGAAAGAATSTAIGRMTAKGVGDAAGTSTATADGELMARGDGTSAGSATSTAVGVSRLQLVGTSTGVAVSVAVGNATVTGVGSAAGAATSVAVGNATVTGVGNAAGSATATADGELKVRGDGAAAGTATTTAEALFTATGTGIAAGLGTATAVGRLTAGIVGTSAGAATTTGVIVDQSVPVVVDLGGSVKKHFEPIVTIAIGNAVLELIIGLSVGTSEPPISVAKKPKLTAKQERKRIAAIVPTTGTASYELTVFEAKVTKGTALKAVTGTGFSELSLFEAKDIEGTSIKVIQGHASAPLHIYSQSSGTVSILLTQDGVEDDLLDLLILAQIAENIQYDRPTEIELT